MVGPAASKAVSIGFMTENQLNRVRAMPVLCALMASSFALAADEEKAAKEDSDKKSEEPVVVLHPEPVTTEHELQLDTGTIHYRAIAGTLPLFEESDGSVKAEIFHVAYMKLEQEGSNWVLPDASTRPILFLFNGGPGSSSVWLHLGAFGPERVDMGDVGALKPAPWKLVPNKASLLDVADLVFVDPVTTGYSRAAEGEDDKQFHGLDQDVGSVAEFIRLFISRHGRWQSPKLIGGESYGTTRAAALADELQDRHGVYLDGVILISSVLDFGTLRFARNNDLPYVLFLPTYAATAWYHGVLDRSKFPTLASAIKAAETWTISEYLVALAEGSSIDARKKTEVVARLAELTGMPAELIEQSNLRIGPSRFRKELLRSKRETVGRLDSRFTGVDANAAGSRPEYDPSYSAIQGPYTAALNHYVRTDLKYESDLPYEILTGRVHPWDYSDFTGRFVDVADRLRSAMLENPNLRVFIASGYFDLATPHFAADYVVDHLSLEPAFLEHVTTRYYPAGHMMYVKDELRENLTKDVRQWMKSADKR